MSHRPRKRFGQHFLEDSGVVAAIVEAIAPAPGENLVEIGPGLGVLTRPLIARAGHIHAVELDRDLVERLTAQFPPSSLTLHAGDALQFDFASLGTGLRIVGNLPYNISTPILFHLAQYEAQLVDLHLMLQREVVERMAAPAGGSDYGRLSVMLQYRFAIEKLFDVPPEAFRPPPEVESAVIRVRPLGTARAALEDEDLFARVVAQAFAQRRKTLRNTLGGLVTAAELESLGIDPGRRAQELSVVEFARLANTLALRDQPRR
jgi:16S rRNA (adenine1518-N6/adenine1519-N6)-dimethyltransferase